MQLFSLPVLPRQKMQFLPIGIIGAGGESHHITCEDWPWLGEVPPGSQAQEPLSSLRGAPGDKDRLWVSHNLRPYRYWHEPNLSCVFPVLSLFQVCQKQLDAPRCNSLVNAKVNIGCPQEIFKGQVEQTFPLGVFNTTKQSRFAETSATLWLLNPVSRNRVRERLTLGKRGCCNPYLTNKPSDMHLRDPTANPTWTLSND